MKRLLIFLLAVLVLASCDFSSGRGGEQPVQPPSDTLNPKKPPSPNSFHQKKEPKVPTEPKVVKKDTSKIVIDSSLSEEFQKLKEEKRLLEEELKKLTEMANNTTVELKKSTYYPSRAQQVQEVLNFIYNKKIKILKNSGMKSLAGERLRKICDIDYCDDEVLKSLDQKCEWLNRVFADGIQMNFDQFYTDKKLYYKLTYRDERKKKSK